MEDDRRAGGEDYAAGQVTEYDGAGLTASSRRHRPARTATSGLPSSNGTASGVIIARTVRLPNIRFRQTLHTTAADCHRARRQPLVHRAAWQNRDLHCPRDRSPSNHWAPAPTPGTSLSARTATSGSPRATTTRSGGSCPPAWRPSSCRPRPPRTSSTLRAGPDGNLLVHRGHSHRPHHDLRGHHGVSNFGDRGVDDRGWSGRQRSGSSETAALIPNDARRVDDRVRGQPAGRQRAKPAPFDLHDRSRRGHLVHRRQSSDHRSLRRTLDERSANQRQLRAALAASRATGCSSPTAGRRCRRRCGRRSRRPWTSGRG